MPEKRDQNDGRNSELLLFLESMRTRTTAVITGSTAIAVVTIYFALGRTMSPWIVWGLVTLAVCFASFFVWQTQRRAILNLQAKIETREARRASLLVLQKFVLEGTHLLADCYNTEFEYQPQWALKWCNATQSFLRNNFPEEECYFYIDLREPYPFQDCEAFRLTPARMHGARLLSSRLHKLKSIVDRVRARTE